MPKGIKKSSGTATLDHFRFLNTNGKLNLSNNEVETKSFSSSQVKLTSSDALNENDSSSNDIICEQETSSPKKPTRKRLRRIPLNEHEEKDNAELEKLLSNDDLQSSMLKTSSLSGKEVKGIENPSTQKTKETTSRSNVELEKLLPNDDLKSSVEKTSNFSEKMIKDIENSSAKKTKETTSSSFQSGKHISYQYDPINEACWKAGERVPYLALAMVFSEIEKVKARLKITELLTNLFRSIIVLTPEDLLSCIYLCVNKISPDFEGLELGVGESVLLKAVADSTGHSLQSVKAAYDEKGDLGLVAQESRSTQKTIFTPPKLTIQGVYKKLKEIALLQGMSSVSRKKELIQSLLVACRSCEAQYLIRSLQGKLRIGLAEKTVLAALSHAVVLSSNQAVTNDLPMPQLEKRLLESNEILRGVYSEVPSYDIVIPILLEFGLDQLQSKCFLTPGIPCHPMLAQPTKGVSEVLDRFTNMTFTCELKYDGERAQIHRLENGEIRVYSRNLENHTSKFPDIIEMAPKILKGEVSSFILDCEVVAYDRIQNNILPFQILSTRARKTVQIDDIKVQICLFAFDLLYLNGKPLLKEPFANRRRLLHSMFQRVEGQFQFAHYKDISDIEEIQSFLQKAVESNCEGLMVKTLDKDASYEPSKRSFNWLKVKKDYVEGMGDSVDLVVIGAYIGRGKRTGVYGGYLLACRDEESEQFQSVCRIGTGFSDEDLKKHYEFFKPYILEKPRPYYSYGEAVQPDVWFDAVQVWEVKAADLSLSPVHKAAIGLVDSSKGIALRFPRFIRIRDDKKPEEATSATQISELYCKQKINHVEKTDEDIDEDV